MLIALVSLSFSGALAQEPPAAPEPADPAIPNATDPIFLLDGICGGGWDPRMVQVAELRGREIDQRNERIALFMTGGTTWDGRGHLLTAGGVSADHVAILLDGVLVEGRSARWTRFR